MTASGRVRHRAVLLTSLAASVPIMLFLSLFIGAKAIAPETVIETLLGADTGIDGLLIMEQRVPRALLALIVGLALAIAGSLMKTVTRNPLADPGILGVTSGATLAFVLGGLLLGGEVLGYRFAFALIGAAIVSVGVALLASRGGRLGSPVTITLVGVAVSTICQGIVLAVALLDPLAFDVTRSWNIGSVADRGIETVLTAAPLIVAGALLAVLLARPLDMVELGEYSARALGVRTTRTTALALVAIVLLTAAATAAAGPLAFVGLIAIHLAQRLVDGGHAVTIVTAALVGAVLVLVADIVGRLLFWPGELGVGTVVALIGAPLLVVLVRTVRAES